MYAAFFRKSTNCQMVPEKTKRKRCKNLTLEEQCLLSDLCVKFGEIIECKKTDVMSSKQKEEAWIRLAVEFNGLSTSGICRDSNQLKQVFSPYVLLHHCIVLSSVTGKLDMFGIV